MNSRRYPNIPLERARAIKSTFLAEGALCAATLYVPKDTPADAQLPAILMVGGWGSVQMALTSSFTLSFVDAGFAVMEFDYPGWATAAASRARASTPGAERAWPTRHWLT